jgi:site-specific recombinase XerD
MNFHYESLKTLTEKAVVYLRNKSKSESTISKYVKTWQQLDKYLHDNKVIEFEKNAVLGFIKEKFGDKRISDLTNHQKSCVSQYFNLIQFKETGEMLETMEHVSKVKPDFTGEIGNLMQDFIILKTSMRLSEKTLGNLKLHLYRFQKCLEWNDIVELQRISPLIILSYSSHLPASHSSSKHSALCIVKSFLRYAYDEKRTNTDLSLVVPRDNYKQQAKLPSTYTKEEVKKILATADRSTATGKRNYALLLLIVRLGLRASDVRELSFENINWAMNTVSFEQCKTGEKVELPLPVDAGDAIIDYLKYGRPETNEKHIFVEHNFPYVQLGEKAIPRIANHAICHSGIAVGCRKHGSHSLRHTMAGFLLEGKTPVPLISDILGHSSIQSTMCYLRVDVENLRQCALDVPIVDAGFYEQKGGIFYE